MRFLIAVLVFLFAVPGVASASDPSGLSCATWVDGKTASGRCEGTGRYRLAATCEDGTHRRSSWNFISGGTGQVTVRCRTRAVTAAVEQA